MKQLEIEFFWPLTQQIPLDLDFTDCEKPKLSLPINGISPLLNIVGYGTTGSNITSSFQIDADTTVVRVKEEPNILRRGLYKALGVKWEKK